MRLRIVLGAVLLAIGATWLLELYGIQIFPGGFRAWWPLLLVVWGVARLVTWPHGWLGGAAWIVLGAIALAWTLGVLPWITSAHVGAAALILVGIIFLTAPWRRRRAWERWQRWANEGEA